MLRSEVRFDFHCKGLGLWSHGQGYSVYVKI